ncbi:MAG: phosphatase PAP2 family protein [Clostridia bacterium]|nr:phosphatase PAP2 family protein [Clostridia bacterium]
MDFDILYAIQNLRCEFLDKFVLALTWLVGDYGQLWAIVGAVMLFFKKTRKCGIAVLVSYALVFLGGQYVLKDLIARERPCVIDQTVELLVARKTSYSCPSTHTAWAFAAATSIFLHFKKWGIGLFVVAAVIGFSRLYLFMHFPTDVLFGAALGAAFAVGTFYLLKVFRKKEPAKEESAQ